MSGPASLRPKASVVIGQRGIVPRCGFVCQTATESSLCIKASAWQIALGGSTSSACCVPPKRSSSGSALWLRCFDAPAGSYRSSYSWMEQRL